MHDELPTSPQSAGEKSNRADHSAPSADVGLSTPTDAFTGLPKWITPALVRETIRVWQPYYKAVLTVKDAAEILLRVRRLGQLLA